MITFHFEFEKTLQAASVLLELDGHRMERLRLLKLLYIADRELLAESGRPLTGDRASAMKYGPVLNQVYRLIKGEDSRAGEWARSIHSDGHSVVLRVPPGRGDLSRREVEKLTELTERYRQTNDWDLSELTHDFREWETHYREGTSTPIPWDDALIAQGKPERIAVAEREATNRRILDDLFGA